MRNRAGMMFGALCCALLIGTACGSTLDQQALTEQAREVFTASASASAEGAPSPTGDGPAVPVTPEEQATSSPGAPAAVAAGSTANASGAAGATPLPGSNRAASAPNASPAAGSRSSAAPAQPGAAKAATQGPAATVPGSPATGSGAPKSPVVLGSIGTSSGPVGAVMVPTIQAARAWAADVNARGGLDGHPVQLVMGDDGGDPSKALSLAKRMVEQDGAVALFANYAPLTFQSVRPYLEQKRIPMIGGCGCHGEESDSPMAFLAGATPRKGLVYGSLLPLTSFSEKRKASLFICSDAPICGVIESGMRQAAGEVGVNIIHQARVSIAQPDYTAEVLAARNAGAEAIIAIIDANSIVRLQRALHRQNWSPVVTSPWSIHDARLLSAGGAEVEGVLTGGALPDWTSPLLSDYRAALKRYVAGGVEASAGTGAWAGGKLLEAIAKLLPAKPTNEDILRGLYALNGETLGGLTPPLSFKDGVGHGDSNLCVYPLRIEKGQFTPKAGASYVCAPGWQPVKK